MLRDVIDDFGCENGRRETTKAPSLRSRNLPLMDSFTTTINLVVRSDTRRMRN